jgi:two-component system, NtrC family, response regulator AtoC
MKSEKESKAKVLIVEDDHSLGNLLMEEVEDAGLASRLVHTAEDALAMAVAWMPDVIVSDLRLPGADGLSLMRQTRIEMPDNSPDFLVITAFGSVSKAVESLKSGAEDFLTKPLDLDHLKISLTRILDKRMMRQQLKQIQTLVNVESTFHGIYGHSRSMLTLFQQIRLVAKSGGPVLVMGESGTGKELVSRAIHLESNSKAKPFLAINCAGIPEHLLESEFFGHEAGAFTGAEKSRQGIFKEAEDGTLLLDEIAEMPNLLQAKLLRMLQDGMVRPVGSNREQRVNVRIIAATNQNLEDLVNKGKFRKDLFYRLETFQLHIPPLREREDDVDLLAGIFLAQHAAAAGKRIDGFSPRTQEILRSYPYPGNVRELQNAVERAVAYCYDREILPEHLPSRIRENCRRETPSRFLITNGIHINDQSLLPLEEVQRRYIDHVMNKVKGNKRLAASILGISRKTLYRHLSL